MVTQQEEAAYEASLLATRPRQGQQTDQRLDSAPKCTTPNGGQGSCRDIQNCPILLADLGTLRKSVCNKDRCLLNFLQTIDDIL